ncbi:hypothetical protein KEJ39_06595 [Candidatus Bathyarchaeota archaeon]|nr:hypothetical protein [Candidatus Bathyarchaeota archaeon]
MEVQLIQNVPDYKEAVKINNSRLLIEALTRSDGIANFSTLEKESGLKGGLLRYHLDRLKSLGVIESEVKGTYRLRFKTPLCYIFGSRNVKYAYIGLLGRRDSYSEPEPVTALSLLKEQRISPTLVYVLTSPEGMADWKEYRLNCQWVICYGDEIIDIDAIQNKLAPQLTALLRDHSVILDCTSSTKPATIAYYDLAQRLLIPCIYVSEEKRSIRWLISKETIMTRLNLKQNSHRHSKGSSPR